MNGFLLDTNVPSEPIRPQPDANVQPWLAAQRLDHLWISAVGFREFRKGIELRSQGKRRMELGSKKISPPCLRVALFR